MKTSYTNKHDRGFYISNDMGEQYQMWLMSKKNRCLDFLTQMSKCTYFFVQTSTSN